jgi:hypothetical protein
LRFKVNTTDIMFNEEMELRGNFEDGSRHRFSIWMLFECDLDESKLKRHFAIVDLMCVNHKIIS